MSSSAVSLKGKTVQEILFEGFTGCSNHDCVVQKRKGVGTNAMCGCLHNLDRTQLNLLKNRLELIADKKLDLE